MINFSNVTSITIPEGNVTKISDSSGIILWQKKSGGDYTFIDSITVPSKTTLDTGVGCKSSDYLYIDFAPLASTIYGAVIHAGTSKIMRFYIDGANGIYAKIDWYNHVILKPVVSGERHNMHMVGQKVFLDGIQKINMSRVPAFTANTNVIVGGIGASMILYCAKHGSNESTLDLDLVPAIRNNDSVAGLYDNITKQFFPYGTATGG